MASSARAELREVLRRGLALLCAVWVVILGLAAVSPELHEEFHHRGDSTAADQCAVELLAHGALVAAPVTAPVPIVAVHPDLAPAQAVELIVSTPRYLLQPERGPPEA